VKPAIVDGKGNATTPRRVDRSEILFDIEKAARRDNPPQPWLSGEPPEVLADNPHDIKKFFESIEDGECGFERHTRLKP
jgi:hypothetical protein